MRKFKYNKLVRDRIVTIQESEGYKVKHEALSDSETMQAILKKLHEESDEVAAAVASGSRTDIVSELADLTELLGELSSRLGVTVEEIAGAQQAKVEKTGAFHDGSFIHHVEVPDGNSMVSYYESQPEKYPEI